MRPSRRVEAAYELFWIQLTRVNDGLGGCSRDDREGVLDRMGFGTYSRSIRRALGRCDPGLDSAFQLGKALVLDPAGWHQEGKPWARAELEKHRSDASRLVEDAAEAEELADVLDWMLGRASLPPPNAEGLIDYAAERIGEVLCQYIEFHQHLDRNDEPQTLGFERVALDGGVGESDASRSGHSKLIAEMMLTGRLGWDDPVRGTKRGDRCALSPGETGRNGRLRWWQGEKEAETFGPWIHDLGNGLRQALVGSKTERMADAKGDMAAQETRDQAETIGDRMYVEEQFRDYAARGGIEGALLHFYFRERLGLPLVDDQKFAAAGWCEERRGDESGSPTLLRVDPWINGDAGHFSCPRCKMDFDHNHRLVQVRRTLVAGPFLQGEWEVLLCTSCAQRKPREVHYVLRLPAPPGALQSHRLLGWRGEGCRFSTRPTKMWVRLG